MRTHGEEQQLPAVGLTNHQLFFVGFAQVWSLGRTGCVSCPLPPKGCHWEKLGSCRKGAGKWGHSCHVGSALRESLVSRAQASSPKSEVFSRILFEREGLLALVECIGASIGPLLLLWGNVEKETVAWEYKMTCSWLPRNQIRSRVSTQAGTLSSTLHHSKQF